MEDEYDTRDCAALKVSFQGFLTKTCIFYMEVLGKTHFSQMCIELRLTSEMFSLHSEKVAGVPFISLHLLSVFTYPSRFFYEQNAVLMINFHKTSFEL